MVRRIELTGDQSRHEAAVGRQHLVGADHREAVAEGDDDRARDSGQLTWQNDVPRHRDLSFSIRVVVPVHAEQVEWFGRVRIDAGEGFACRSPDRGGVGQLGERRKHDAAFTEGGERPVARGAIYDLSFQSQLIHAAFPAYRLSGLPRSHGATESRRDRTGRTWLSIGMTTDRSLPSLRAFSVSLRLCGCPLIVRVIC